MLILYVTLLSTFCAGFSALHAAVLASIEKTVEILLSAGADPNVLDDDGKNHVKIYLLSTLIFGM